jgi:hypothetical protein
MIPTPSSCLLLASTLLLAACASAPREAAQPTPAPAPTRTPTAEEKRQNLRKGMTETEIRAAWGEPKAVHPGKPGETVLIYEFKVLSAQNMVASSMVEVPNYDPINGAYKPVMEPVLAPQNVTVTQTIVLLLVEDRLTGWTRQLGEQRTFN